ncbi:ATP synthase subunit I [Lonepinella koalarum]|uniref:ATP synthase subunit I n=1 Tax=Lonepinella koalarum TaxID=53417 RepID=UPI003F6DB1FE
MSAVLQRAQKLYKKVYLIEIVVLIAIFGILFLYNNDFAYAFSIGFLVIFVPSVFVIYIAFFVKKGKPIDITLFYRLEAIKFLFAIILIVISIKYLITNNILVFFIGFFVALALNSLLPFILNIFKQRN